jgi:glycosyltransferase involved in cell wall biosynthesis
VSPDLILIPFHDWRKCLREGFRTRDAHLIEAFSKGGAFGKVLVVSRPITRLELAVFRQPRDPGQVISLRGSRWHVFKDVRGCHVFEYFDPGLITQALEGKAWFFKAYVSEGMRDGLREAIEEIGLDRPTVLSMNIRSAGLAASLAARGFPIAFDAWDNWLRFPLRHRLQHLVQEGYATFARIAPLWFTNSAANRDVFRRRFGVPACLVVPNGVDPHRFGLEEAEPKALRAVPRPRALFGGKITHLFDATLFNEITRRLPSVHFVVVGQIIDRAVWGRVRKARNVHYLGDVHYEEYPSYVSHADVCIAPYVGTDRAHGGDSIKLYEYAAAGRPTVASGGDGVHALTDYVTFVNSAEEFTAAIERCFEGQVCRPQLSNLGFSWDERVRFMTESMRSAFDPKPRSAGPRAGART